MRALVLVLRAVLVALLVFVIVGVTGHVRTSIQRSRQKRTMAHIHLAAERFEKGQPIGALRDAWDRPMRVHVAGKHYLIQSAASDGMFERGPFKGQAPNLEDDIVLIDGIFWQMPEGI